jgi:hypothetical protein
MSSLRRRLKRWRVRHGGRGRRIPEDLWAEAIKVASVEGIEVTARELSLDSARLESRIAAIGRGSIEDAEFVEVIQPPTEHGPAAPSTSSPHSPRWVELPQEELIGPVRVRQSHEQGCDEADEEAPVVRTTIMFARGGGEEVCIIETSGAVDVQALARDFFRDRR